MDLVNSFSVFRKFVKIPLKWALSFICIFLHHIIVKRKSHDSKRLFSIAQMIDSFLKKIYEQSESCSD